MGSSPTGVVSFATMSSGARAASTELRSTRGFFFFFFFFFTHVFRFRIGPAGGERVGEHGVVGTGGDDGVLVARVRGRLLCRQQSRSHSNAVGARGQRGREQPSARDATRREHRNRDRVEHFGEERPQRARSVHAAAAFGAAHHEEVAPGVDGGAGFFERADLPAREGATLVDDPYQ